MSNNFEHSLLAELEKKDSSVRAYIASVITRIVLEHASLEERQLFKKWLETDNPKAIDWVLKKAQNHQKQIDQELVKFFKKVKARAINGKS